MAEQDIDYGRRRVGMGLMAASIGIAAAVEGAESDQKPAAVPQATGKSTYLLVYRRGPRWIEGKPMAEQGLRDHGRYMLELFRKGALRYAGGFADDSGGAVMLEAKDDAEASAIAAADPAVTAQIFVFDLRRWKLQPWAEIAERADKAKR